MGLHNRGWGLSCLLILSSGGPLSEKRHHTLKAGEVSGLFQWLPSLLVRLSITLVSRNDDQPNMACGQIDLTLSDATQTQTTASIRSGDLAFSENSILTEIWWVCTDQRCPQNPCPFTACQRVKTCFDNREMGSGTPSACLWSAESN